MTSAASILNPPWEETMTKQLKRAEAHHPEWVWFVLVEHPGAAGRSMGVTVIHRDQVDEEVEWCERRQIESGNVTWSVRAGDNWRPLVTEMVPRLAARLRMSTVSVHNDIFITADTPELTDEINDHLSGIYRAQ
jgi:hypothetical protein